MRILFTIPHYWREANSSHSPDRAEDDRRHGATSLPASERAASLAACIHALHQQFGRSQSLIQLAARRTTPANRAGTADVHVMVCTTGNNHLLDQAGVDPRLYRDFPTDAAPLQLGFYCHGVLRDRWGNFDYYCYLEDDLILHDPWLFAKLAWFNRHVGDEKLLQPNRFERGTGPRNHKVYVDGDLRPEATARFQRVDEKPVLKSTVMDCPVIFRRTYNPHAGCFFLNQRQMQHWIAEPYFLDRDTSFIGPLESAATLGIMRAFQVYKPGSENADFLEVEHSGNRYLSLIRYRERDPQH